MSKLEPLLTVADVASILQVSEETIRKYVRMEVIPYVKLTPGRMSAVRFREESLEEWIAYREVNWEREKWKRAEKGQIIKVMSSLPSKDSGSCKLHPCKDLENPAPEEPANLGRISNIMLLNINDLTPKYTKEYQKSPSQFLS